MEILCHRGIWKNQEEQNMLKSFKKAFELGFGIETDVRDFHSRLVISHDPPITNALVYLDDLFELYNHLHIEKTIAINIKSDGISLAIRDLIKKYNIENFFTFDMSIPELLQYKSLAIRYFSRISEYEREAALIDGAIGIWLDVFESEWYSEEYLMNLMNDKLVCFVSSELHGRDYRPQWATIKKCSKGNNFMLCTDKPNRAKKYFND